MKKLDTAELLAEEDEKALQFIQTVKQNLSSILGADNIINDIRKIINKSDHFAFRSKRNEKLISKTRPLFVLTYDVNKLVADYGQQSTSDINLIRNLVQDEITSVFSRNLSSMLRDKDVLHELIENSGFKGIDESLLIMMPFITTAIFAINVELSTGIVYLEYVM